MKTTPVDQFRLLANATSRLYQAAYVVQMATTRKHTPEGESDAREAVATITLDQADLAAMGKYLKGLYDLTADTKAALTKTLDNWSKKP